MSHAVTNDRNFYTGKFTYKYQWRAPKTKANKSYRTNSSNSSKIKQRQHNKNLQANNLTVCSVQRSAFNVKKKMKFCESFVYCPCNWTRWCALFYVLKCVFVCACVLFSPPFILLNALNKLNQTYNQLLRTMWTCPIHKATPMQTSIKH